MEKNFAGVGVDALEGRLLFHLAAVLFGGRWGSADRLIDAMSDEHGVVSSKDVRALRASVAANVIGILSAVAFLAVLAVSLWSANRPALLIAVALFGIAVGAVWLADRFEPHARRWPVQASSPQ